MIFLGRDKAFMERVTKLHEGDNGSILAAIEDYWDVDTITAMSILTYWNNQYAPTMSALVVPGPASTTPTETADCGYLPYENSYDEYDKEVTEGAESTEPTENADCGYLPCCCDEYHFPMNKRPEPTEPTEVAAKQAPGEPAVNYYDGVPLTKVERFQILAERLADTYRRKNADYGDSFGRSVEKYGIIAALTRMSDKWNRLENLILKDGKSEVADESVLDTLLDLAAYSLMTYMEVEDGAIKKG